MLSTVLAATATVLGAGILLTLWLRFRPPSGSGVKPEGEQVPFRHTVEEMLVRLSNVESQLANIPNRMEDLRREAHNANERANYHAKRAEESAATVREIREEIAGLLEDEDEDVRSFDEDRGRAQGVLPLRAGVDARDREDERDGVEVEGPSPFDIARMNSGG